MPSPHRRLPAHLLNGLAVALGIAVIQALLVRFAGLHAAQLAAGTAVCASLADTPTTVSRVFQRVAMAALLACTATLCVALLKPWPLALGVGVGLLTFGAMMTMAWGVRAGPVSFAAVLAVVFAMAAPGGRDQALSAFAWNCTGAAAYVVWAPLSAWSLQRRYSTLALAAAMEASSRLLRSRADVLEAWSASDADDALLRGWIGGEAVLAEKLQAARDLLFDAPDRPRSRRQIAMLLHTIELRDTLLASRLDLDVAGSDEIGRALRGHVAQGLRQVARRLDEAREALLQGNPPAAAIADATAAPPDLGADPRSRLLPGLNARLQRLMDGVARIERLLRGEEEPLPLSHAELQLFVAPEGWPLSALKAQCSRRSPVLRHAVRAGLALMAAYFIARLLPWASHPHWLVLSVAVVLRGNLEQTLSRRNARVLGTALGCVIVVALAPVHSAPLLAIAFLLAVGTAHSFVLVRYLVTAAAATVMALLQSHAVDPSGGFPIAERLADTVLGAALAWAFSYVWPSWERRLLPLGLSRALQALRGYAHEALSPTLAAGVSQRLARLKAYDALGAVAMAAQRTTAEPQHVQLPLRPLLATLDHAYRLMAHLSVVRLTLARNAHRLSDDTARELREADGTLQRCLDLGTAPPAEDPLVTQAPPWISETLPEHPPAEAPEAWLLRRLELSVYDAEQTQRKARAVVGSLKSRAA